MVMPVPTLDFGLFIAYVVPGMIALYGLSFVSQRLKSVCQPDSTTAPSVGGAVLVTLVALVIGRLLSIGRAAVIDQTFRVPVPVLDCSHAPQRGAVRGAAPDYLQLTDEGRREAFRLAIANEQRPYQFAGNTAIAMVLATTCWLISLDRRERRRKRDVMAVIGTLALVSVLYASARVSHYRFVRAVTVLNGQQFQSFDHAGKPCRATD